MTYLEGFTEIFLKAKAPKSNHNHFQRDFLQLTLTDCKDCKYHYNAFACPTCMLGTEMHLQNRKSIEPEYIAQKSRVSVTVIAHKQINPAIQ